jgi:hypothetical protein
MMKGALPAVALFVCAALAGPVWGGPPYASDDPEPTDLHHFEIYHFASGTEARDGSSEAFGIDFNYGAAPDLQLTAVLPYAFSHPSGEPTAAGLGNLQLGVKYRFLHQDQIGWDVAFFPHYYLSSFTPEAAQPYASYLLPIWMEKDWGPWSTFGGGGCVIQQGATHKNFCFGSWALTRALSPQLRLGAELVHQAGDAWGTPSSTGIGAGMQYDFSACHHLLAYIGPTLQNAEQTTRYSWYIALLLTVPEDH